MTKRFIGNLLREEWNEAVVEAAAGGWKLELMDELMKDAWNSVVPAAGGWKLDGIRG